MASTSFVLSRFGLSVRIWSIPRLTLKTRLRCPSRTSEYTPADLQKVVKWIPRTVPHLKKESGWRSSGRSPPILLKRPLVFGGILAFLGLDEEAKLDKKYEDEAAKASEEGLDSKLKDIIKLGILNIQKGDPGKAEEMFHIALRLAQDVGHEKAITYVLYLMADLAFEVGDSKKAEKLYVSVMQRLIGDGVSLDDNAIVEMSLKCARMQGNGGLHEKAILGFQHCVEVQEKKMEAGAKDEDTVALWGMARDWFAQYWMSRGDYPKAYENFSQAYKVSCELSGESHERSLILLNSLGTVASMMGDTKNAKECFDKVVTLARSSNSDHLASFLVNSGMLMMQMGLIADARRFCGESFGLALKANQAEATEEAKECLQRVKEMSTQSRR